MRRKGQIQREISIMYRLPLHPLQVDEGGIVAPEPDDPNAVGDLGDAEAPSGEDGRDVDLLGAAGDRASIGKA